VSILCLYFLLSQRFCKPTKPSFHHPSKLYQGHQWPLYYQIQM
jgi:hypothetical protein